MKNILDVLQNQPERRREKILWGGVILAAIILISLFIFQFKSNFSNTEPVSSNTESTSEELPSSKILNKNLKNLIQMIKELGNTNKQNFKGLDRLDNNLKES